jgi:hypothetical protein
LHKDVWAKKNSITQLQSTGTKKFFELLREKGSKIRPFSGNSMKLRNLLLIEAF